MLVWRRVFVFLAAVVLTGWLCFVPAIALEKTAAYLAALESITTDDLIRHVKELADKKMEGREAGTRGGLAAAQYLADQLAQLRLSAAGSEGYFQPLPPNYRNVLALLEGRDRQLGSEVIVLGAHYDHIGYGGYGASRGPYGYLHPGADDNASGTSSVLEVAEAFTFLPEAPRRSLLFAFWDAEEKGLHGSKHWAAHPTIAAKQVVAAINLDMLGRLRDRRLLIYGSRSGIGWRRLLSFQNDAALQLEFPWSLKPASDHYPFFEQGVPVVMFHTGLHNDCHRPSDTPERLDPEGMRVVVRVLFSVLFELAEEPNSLPKFRPEAQNETADDERAAKTYLRPPERLGVGWREDAAVVGGIRVSHVFPDSPAERAGIQVGDVILRFASRVIQRDEDFFAAVRTAVSPATLVLKRPAVEEQLVLQVRLAGEPWRWGFAWRVDEAEPGAVIITHVLSGTPAASAGLSPEDRVYQIGGRDFADAEEFAQTINSASAPLRLLIEHNGRLQTVTLSDTTADKDETASTSSSS